MNTHIQNNESSAGGIRPKFETLGKKIKKMSHKIWEDVNTSPEEWSYYNAYKDKPDKFTISYTAFYYPEDLNSIRETIRYYYDSLQGDEKPDYEPFYYAMVAYGRLQAGGKLKSPYIGVVDFSKPNTQRRFFIINIKTLKIENAVCTGHGINSGKGEIPTEFSNEKNSLKSSIGAFVTEGKLKTNKKGTRKGIQLTGLDNPNYRARSRGIFIHPGGLDQSEGCFTIPYEHDKEEVYNVIKKLEGNCLVYAYYSEDDVKGSWLVNPNFKNERQMDKASIHLIYEDIKSVASKTKANIKKVFTKKKSA